METKHWYDIHETGIARYPKYQLTHMNGSKRYMILILDWNTESNKANGWFPLAERDTIREARAYMIDFIRRA